MRRTIIIAEAGVNHNGSLELAKELISKAAQAGADYVKFQTFKSEKLVSANAVKADYQKKNTKDQDESQYKMIKKLELSYDNHFALKKHCETMGIKFLSTGFDEESIDFLEQLGVDLFKIPSGEITNKPYLQHIARKRKEIIMSTGMADMEEIRAAISVLKHEGISDNMITVLHCNTEYPTPMNDVNLLSMNTIGKEFNVKVGYSDHTLGIEVPIAAVALGACVIEKHFTLDRGLSGPDHKASLEPEELKAMVLGIRNIELALGGDGEKKPSQSEIPNIIIARKSIHFSKHLKAGDIISKSDLVMKRPGSGISPMEYEKMLGKVLKKDATEDQIVSWEDFD